MKHAYNWTLPTDAELTIPECYEIAHAAAHQETKERQLLGIFRPSQIDSATVRIVFGSIKAALSEQRRLE